MDWMEQLSERAKEDLWYLKCLAEVQRKEASYLLILDSLPKEKRQQLQDYIAACEELEYALAPIAYQLGKEQTVKLYQIADQ